MIVIPNHRAGIVAFVWVVVALAGCSESGPKRLAVEGTVQFKGSPLKQGSIQFEPMNQAQGYSAGAMIVDGRYSIAAKDGLLPGKYSVKIFSSEASTAKADAAPGSFKLAKELLPPKYNMQTKLTAEITDPPAPIPFNLD